MNPIHAPPVPQTWLDLPAPSIWDRGGWIILLFFAPAMICAFFEEGPGWLILKWLGRIALCALMAGLGVVTWYVAASVPVSVAILLGAGIIALAVRSSAGRVRRLTAQSQDVLEPPRQDYPYSIGDR